MPGAIGGVRYDRRNRTRRRVRADFARAGGNRDDPVRGPHPAALRLRALSFPRLSGARRSQPRHFAVGSSRLARSPPRIPPMNRLAATLTRSAATLVIALAAIAVAWWMWNHYERSPWTRDGRVRADVVRVTPDIGGLIT